jgi:hypothetical protein
MSARGRTMALPSSASVPGSTLDHVVELHDGVQLGPGDPLADLVAC